MRKVREVKLASSVCFIDQRSVVRRSGYKIYPLDGTSRRGKNVGVRKVKICVRKLAANASDFAVRRCPALTFKDGYA